MAPSFDNESSLFNFAVRDGNDVKGIVDSGISKVPQAYIQPPAEQIDKKNASKCEIPPIDLSAAETLGFFQVVNHGVPIQLLDSLKQTAHNFFSLPAERKAVYRKEVSSSPLVKYGTSFVPEKERALEWKDYVSMAYANDAEALQQWPIECRNLLEALLGSLGVELDDSKIDAFIEKKWTSFCYGTLTILLQDGIGDLYVKVSKDPITVDMEKNGEWVEISPIPGALVINVVRTTSTKLKVSIPIFTNPLPTQEVAPLPLSGEKRWSNSL
ncbi:hypothetical protein ERO13_A01G039900v2 [Gossypium hirsutum]|nr:hypothetical protein ERO13_A01G039900v2 [Gossypium hirsutum]